MVVHRVSGVDIKDVRMLGCFSSADSSKRPSCCGGRNELFS